MGARTVWMNGELVEEAKAALSPFDHGVLYGDGIFEGLRFYRRVPFRLEAHLDRLWRSAAVIRLALPYDRAQLRRALDSVIAASGETDGYVRLVVTRGPGELGLDPRSCPRPTVFLTCAAFRLFGEGRAAGITAIIASTRQTPPDALDARLKSLNYLPRVLARLEANHAGAGEAIMLNQRGFVAEATVENVFVVRAGVLSTPPPTEGALEGITRAVVLELARAAQIPTREEPLAPYDLHTADEVFLTGTGAELVPVRSVDGRDAASCPGPLFLRLSAAFRALVDRESGG